MQTVTKQIAFCAGHRVLGHQGKCRHLHGHNYVAEITIESEELDSLGMVVDFGEIKDKIGKWIDTNWDHNLLLNSEDPQLKHIQETEEKDPYVFIKKNPTAEVMATHLGVIVSGTFIRNKRIRVTKIRVYESDTGWAEFSERNDSSSR